MVFLAVVFFAVRFFEAAFFVDLAVDVFFLDLGADLAVDFFAADLLVLAADAFFFDATFLLFFELLRFANRVASDEVRRTHKPLSTHD